MRISRFFEERLLDFHPSVRKRRIHGPLLCFRRNDGRIIPEPTLPSVRRGFYWVWGPYQRCPGHNNPMLRRNRPGRAVASWPAGKQTGLRWLRRADRLPHTGVAQREGRRRARPGFHVVRSARAAYRIWPVSTRSPARAMNRRSHPAGQHGKNPPGRTTAPHLRRR